MSENVSSMSTGTGEQALPRGLDHRPYRSEATDRSCGDVTLGPFGVRLERYVHFAGSLPGSIGDLMKVRRIFEPGMHLLYKGEPGGRAFIIDKGWSFSSCTQSSGSRQILDVQVPGDVAGLQSLALPYAMHDVTAITRIEAFEINSVQINETIADDPELAAFLLWLLAGDGAVAAERLTDLGRRSALERTAHFILELAARLRLAGMGSDLGFACPMTQYLFADALGLTPVHVNRIFRELRLGGLASHARGWLSLLDTKRLAVTAMFESDYLDHTSPLVR